MSEQVRTPDDERDDAPQESAERPGGTPDGDDGDDNRGRLIATLQENVSKERREREARDQRIAELEAELDRSRTVATTPPTNGAAGEIDREMQVIQRMNARIEAAANDPSHPEHEAALYERARNRTLFQRLENMAMDLKFDAMPEHVRAGAKKMFETGDYRTPEAARRAYLGSLTDDERAQLSPKARVAAPREREEVVETGTRPLSAVGVQQRQLRRGEWEREYDKAAANGDTTKLEQLRRNFPRD